jgi:hypothetical protein
MERAKSMLTYNARPRESGQQAITYLQSAGSQIPAERNIRASAGWLWQERSTLQRINKAFNGARLLTARSIYLALTECASQQRTPGRAHTSCAYLGSLAGCSERNARRYLHEFAALGLIAIEPGVHRANTYILLGQAAPSDNLANAVMPLADSAGNSVTSPPSTRRPAPEQAPTFGNMVTAAAERGGDIPDRPAPAVSLPTPASAYASDPSLPARGDNADHPDRLRGDAGGSQDITNESNKPKNQTNRGDGDEGRVVIADESLAASDPPNRADIRLLITSEEQRAAVLSLTGIGVRRVLAEQLAASHDASIIRAWVRYALKTGGLKSKAGFVLSRLRAGEQPPLISSSLIMYAPPASDQPPPASGLIAASPPPAEQVAPASAAAPPTASAIAVWQTVQGGLLASASTGARIWLQQVRLLRLTDGQATLSSPPLGAHTSLAQRYQGEIAAQLAEVLGRVMQVEFVSGW